LIVSAPRQPVADLLLIVANEEEVAGKSPRVPSLGTQHTETGQFASISRTYFLYVRLRIQ
jgi:hypothetical protein